jgi:DNA-directed RNA polymerase specialized sigma24 family protein
MLMSPEGSVTRWITGLRGGDAQAARQLWDRFYQRMQALARPESPPCLTGGVYDEEDVALSAFANFCGALQRGNYPHLEGRDDLWRLLATFTLRKARERARQARAQKRGGGASLACGPQDGEPLDPDRLADRTPAPELMVLMAEQCQHLLGLLGDPELVAVALWKLEGHSNEEIAALMGYTRRTVQRMLSLIRQLWEECKP